MPTTIAIGVDTHADTHHASAVTATGRILATSEFVASTDGYEQLATWAARHGTITQVGIEGTGAYGAGLARHLTAAGLSVVEVPRPTRRLRRDRGKSDPIDATAAARAVLAGTVSTPKAADGPVEALRALRIARQGALKAKTAAINTMRSLIVTAPDTLRDRLPRGATALTLTETCARLRPNMDRLDEPDQATKAALRTIARRARTLRNEILQLDRAILDLLETHAPTTLATFGMGPDTTAQLLITAGDNPDRMHSEAAFARLCGAAPIPASSGKTTRHRLNRGGDRAANRALHTTAVVRMRHCPRTRAYVTRRTAQGRTKPEIIRCLKRYIAREVFRAIMADISRLDQ